MKIEIDTRSGFCFGVIKAIQTAEQEIESNGELYCLGDIVHNEQEVARLEALGLKVISHNQLKDLNGKRVLIRAHGEPPLTYSNAKQKGIEVVDATCPVVIKLQQRVHKAWQEMKALNGTIVIYGKKGHAEVVGLAGQTNDEAIVVESVNDLDPINYAAPVTVFSQTTKEPETFLQIVDEIRNRMSRYYTEENLPLKVNNTICGQVANRKKELADFATKHDVIIFVSGIKSSNGKMLFEACRQANPRTYFVSEPEELNPKWFDNAESVGVGGATSTPQWLMESVAKRIEEIDVKK